jgi:hypothetical protein
MQEYNEEHRKPATIVEMTDEARIALEAEKQANLSRLRARDDKREARALARPTKTMNQA